MFTNQQHKFQWNCLHGFNLKFVCFNVASRKKLTQIARVFTGKKKKSTARNILNQGDTHAKDNLFLHEEDC